MTAHAPFVFFVCVEGRGGVLGDQQYRENTHVASEVLRSLRTEGIPCLSAYQVLFQVDST